MTSDWTAPLAAQPRSHTMRVGYWRDSMSERGTDAAKLSIVPGTQQKARREAGGFALKRRTDAGGSPTQSVEVIVHADAKRFVVMFRAVRGGGGGGESFLTGSDNVDCGRRRTTEVDMEIFNLG